MTEAEWLTDTDPQILLYYLGRRAGQRKRRLFACACCRRVRHLFGHDALNNALNAAEQFADGLIGLEELRLWQLERQGAADFTHPPTRAVGVASADSASYADVAAGYAADAVADAEELLGSWAGIRAEEQRLQCDLLRDIIGNPFQPVAFSPEWKTDTARSLARSMYDSRDFSAMPILADALQDAGCGDAEVLAHCRSGGVHVRGCWVVDLVLGK